MSYVGSEATEQCEDCELQLKFSLLTYLLTGSEIKLSRLCKVNWQTDTAFQRLAGCSSPLPLSDNGDCTSKVNCAVTFSPWPTRSCHGPGYLIPRGGPWSCWGGGVVSHHRGHWSLQTSDSQGNPTPACHVPTKLSAHLDSPL